MTHSQYRTVHPHRKASKYIALLLGLGALAFLAVLCAVSALAHGAVTGTPPPADGVGDWTIATSTSVADARLRLDGDIVVRPGLTLSIDRSAIELAGSGPHSIVVMAGATLLADRTVITAAACGPDLTFKVRGAARLTRCDISRVAGGVQALSDGLVIEGTRIHDCPGPAIELHGNDATIIGCTIESVDVGVSSIATAGMPGIMAIDGWSFVLADTTISARTNGVYLYWKKTLTGDLDLDFATVLSNVNITTSTKDGIYCYMDLLDSGGSGVLDSLFDLRVTGGYSSKNGGSGIYVYHYIKTSSMSGKITASCQVSLVGTKLDSNGAHGLYLLDTLYNDQGSAPSIAYKTDVSLDGCQVSSNAKDGVHVERPRTVYYSQGTGDKVRSATITLKDTTVKGNTENGVYAYDSHYAYSARAKFLWTNTINLRGATIDGNGKDGVYDYLYETLYYGDRVGVDYRQYFDFQDSTISRNGGNGFDLLTGGYMYYHGEMSLRNELKLARCRVHNNTALAGKAQFDMYGYDWQYTFYRRGQYLLDSNRIEDNQAGGVSAKWTGWSYLAEFDVTARVVGNLVRNNGADRGIGLEGMQGNKGEAIATANTFDGGGGGGGTTALDLVYFSQYVVYANTFKKDTHRALVRCYAYGTAGPSPNVGPKYGDWVQIYENTFLDCGPGTGTGDGAAVVDSYSGAGSLLVVDNVMRGCTGNGVAATRMYGGGTLYVKRNTFEGIGGSAVALSASSTAAKAEVVGNYMGNATGPTGTAFALIQDDTGSSVKVEDNRAMGGTCAGVVSTGGTGPKALTVRNNQLVGLGGNAIDLVGQSFTVEGNNLTDCKGFAIALRGFTSLPTVGLNTIARAENGLLLEAKERTDGKRLKIFMDNVTWEVNETAISTDHLDLVVTNSTLLGRRALVADDGTLTAISSQVPYISGSTGTEGRIEVYYRLSLNLTWANATGVDSGLPAPDSLIVFRRATGGYYTSRIADREGQTKPELFPAWMVVGGHLDKISPYDLEITASGLTTHAQLRLEGDQDAHVGVVDWALPSVSVEKPYSGALVNTADLTVKGFLSERGSGLAGAWASLDGKEWAEVAPDDVWVARFEGLRHGHARVYARAMDRSGNTNVTFVDFDIDLMGPALEVLRPLDGTRTPDSYVVIEAKTEKTAELFLDGVPVPNRNGMMFERMRITQGLNIIVVEAVDGSGNANVQVLHVWLDTVPPALFVSSPLEGEVASAADILVEGRTEVAATVTVNELPVTVGPDGWFRLDYHLTSRENLLAIESRDEAGNVNASYRRVTLDDMPPEFSVLQPRDGLLTSATQVVVEGSVGQSDLDSTVYINGERVEQLGRFTTTVVLVEGENRITVMLVDPDGRSSSQVVRVVRDTTAPMVALRSPPSTTWTTRSGELVVAGMAPTASELLLGGTRIALGADGSFNHTLQLEAGENALELVAKDAAGNADTLVLHVMWDSSPPELRLVSLPRSTTEETLLLNGTTEGVVVRVNGVPVPVEEDVFSVPVHLGLGINTFEVVAEDPAGNIASSTVSIERTDASSVTAEEGLGIDWLVLLPLVVTVAALVATAVILRRAPPMAGRHRNGNGRRGPNGHAPTMDGTGRPAAVPPAPEPLMVDLEPVPAPVPTLAPLPAVEAPSYTSPPPPPAPEPFPEQGRRARRRLEVAREPPASPPEPAPMRARRSEPEFAPLPVYSVPDPSTVGTVDVGSNGEYAMSAPPPPSPPEVESVRWMGSAPSSGPLAFEPPTPEPVLEPTAMAAPEPVPMDTPEPVPWAMPESEPVREPAPEMRFWTPPAPEPEPEVPPWTPTAPESVPEPVPEPVPEHVPEPVPEPVLEPVPEPAPEPQVRLWTPPPVPEPEPEVPPWTPPVPEPVREPVQQPALEPVPEPVPEPVLEPVPEPAPEPQVRLWTPPPVPEPEPEVPPWTPPAPESVMAHEREPTLELDLEPDADDTPNEEVVAVRPTERPTPEPIRAPASEPKAMDAPPVAARPVARAMPATAPRPAPRPVARPVPTREAVPSQVERPSMRVHRGPLPASRGKDASVYVAPLPQRPVPKPVMVQRGEVQPVHAPSAKPMVVKVPADRLRPAEHQAAPQPRYPRPSVTSAAVSKPHIKSRFFSHEGRPAPHEAPPPPPREVIPPPATDVPAPQEPAERTPPSEADADITTHANGSKELRVIKELLEELDMGDGDET